MIYIIIAHPVENENEWQKWYSAFCAIFSTFLIPQLDWSYITTSMFTVNITFKNGISSIKLCLPMRGIVFHCQFALYFTNYQIIVSVVITIMSAANYVRSIPSKNSQERAALNDEYSLKYHSSNITVYQSMATQPV